MLDALSSRIVQFWGMHLRAQQTPGCPPATVPAVWSCLLRCTPGSACIPSDAHLGGSSGREPPPRRATSVPAPAEISTQAGHMVEHTMLQGAHVLITGRHCNRPPQGDPTESKMAAPTWCVLRFVRMLRVRGAVLLNVTCGTEESGVRRPCWAGPFVQHVEQACGTSLLPNYWQPGTASAAAPHRPLLSAPTSPQHSPRS